MSLETSRRRSVFGGYPIDAAPVARNSQRNEPEIAMDPVTGTGDIGTPFGNILGPCLDPQRRPTSQKPRPGSDFLALGAIFCSRTRSWSDPLPRRGSASGAANPLWEAWPSPLERQRAALS